MFKKADDVNKRWMPVCNEEAQSGVHEVTGTCGTKRNAGHVKEYLRLLHCRRHLSGSCLHHSFLLVKWLKRQPSLLYASETPIVRIRASSASLSQQDINWPNDPHLKLVLLF